MEWCFIRVGRISAWPAVLFFCKGGWFPPFILGKVCRILEESKKIMLSVKEFSELSGLGEKSIRRLSHVQGFPVIRNGVRIMIHRQAADAWLADYAQHQDSCLPTIG